MSEANADDIIRVLTAERDDLVMEGARLRRDASRLRAALEGIIYAAPADRDASEALRDIQAIAAAALKGGV